MGAESRYVEGSSEAGNIQRMPRAEIGSLMDADKQLQEIKKEIVEARNLVIKTDNLLKNLHAELKQVSENQKSFEKRSRWNAATAYIIFSTLAGLGAYKYASVEMRARTEELAAAKAEVAKDATSRAAFDAAEREAKAESTHAAELFEKLAGGDDDKRNRALAEIATMQPKHLTSLEARALQDKSLSLKVAAAQSALENGKSAFNRHDWRAANDELTRYITLASKPDETANFLLAQARFAIKDYAHAIEPLQVYLKAAPNSKSADYATMILGECYAETGDPKKAIDIYRTGADRFGASQYSTTMRNRARRLEKDARGAADKPVAGTGAVPH